MKILTREQLKKKAKRFEDVSIDGNGTGLRVQEMSLADRIEFGQLIADGKDAEDVSQNVEFASWLLCRTLVDDKGVTLYKPDETDAMMADLGSSMIDPLVTAALGICGLTADAGEDAAGNSEASPN